MGNLSEKPLEQYRKPEGEVGKLGVQDMDESHYGFHMLIRKFARIKKGYAV